jgi:hypothetical protein
MNEVEWQWAEHGRDLHVRSDVSINNPIHIQEGGIE